MASQEPIRLVGGTLLPLGLGVKLPQDAHELLDVVVED